ncbi:TRAP transporter small permease [Sediminimonas sp.]|uniref:TRAP transporter small permease n=1 Tax=Sediminimonas sp. TaxID=2823379 RepID=UPI0025CEE8C4|nr:TRAP transporter small permease [Sediminimonas sp.]
MSASNDYRGTALGRAVDEFERSAIAVILGAMTLITFTNVVLRYGFNTGLIWGLEATSFLFAWLVLFGASHAVKITANLGVDALISYFSPQLRRLIGLLAVALCLFYAAFLLKGAWDYWANFANLPQTTGRWFPTGFEDMGRTSYRAWYEVIDIPFPEWLRWIEPLMNEGERYEKMPRFIPYAILPVGVALLLFRFVQAALRIWRGQASELIVSHEAEDAVADSGHLNEKD